MVSRRWVVSALLAGAAAPALAGAPATSPLPPANPARRTATLATRAIAHPDAGSLIEAARLGGRVAYAVADTRSGEVLETHRGDDAIPPASVMKALTAAYALEALGPGHRFRTRVLGTGPIRSGRLEGDLILLGGGDPVLGSDALGDIGARLRDIGLREVAGRFIVHGGALPTVAVIDAEQPPHVGYNPAVSGINVNFNRVNFQWTRKGGGYEIVMDAPDARFRPAVNMARMRVVERATPVYTYANSGPYEEWTVSAAALGRGGSRWLPVRHPELYAGDIFRQVAAYHGIRLPGPEVSRSAVPRGEVLAEHRSIELRTILRDMLRYSTNLTAEAVGLSASIARGGRPATLSESGATMAQWLTDRFGVGAVTLVDHSGLGDGSRISAAAMVRFLVGAGADGPLRDLLRDHQMRDGQGTPIRNHPLKVSAKTGTLNFVSALGGYVATPAGRDLAFAIFTADLETRRGLPMEQREGPPGGRAWAGRSRRLQQQLIERWGGVYG